MDDQEEEEVILLNQNNTNNIARDANSPTAAGATAENCATTGIEKFGGKIVLSKKGSAYIIDDDNDDIADEGGDDELKHNGANGGQEHRGGEDKGENEEEDAEGGGSKRGNHFRQPLEESPILKPLLTPFNQLVESPFVKGNENSSKNNNNNSIEEPNNTTTDCNNHPPRISNAFYVTRSAAYYNSLYGQAYAKMLRERMVLPTPDSPIVHSYRVYSMREDDNSADKSG